MVRIKAIEENNGVPLKDLSLFVNPLGKLPETSRKILSQKVPQEFIYQRQGRGGLKLSYVSIGYVVNILNEALGESWSFEVFDVGGVELISKTRQIVVKGRLTIQTDREPIVKEQYGSSDVKVLRAPNPDAGKPVDIGDDFKAAASDALKKCASLLGVAKELYFMDLDRVEKETGVTPVVTELDHLPVTLADRQKLLYDRMVTLKYTKDQMQEILKNAKTDTFKNLTEEDVVNINNYLDVVNESR